MAPVTRSAAPAPLPVAGHNEIQFPAGVSLDERQSTWHHIPVSLWNKYVADARGSGTVKKTAMNNLRKYNDARRLVETDEGMIAGRSCDKCMKKGKSGRMRPLANSY